MFEGKQPTTATEVWMEHGKERVQRLFDPYTGADLGDSVPQAIRVAAWLAKLHTDLLYGDNGRKVNGIGAIFLTLLCVTGFIVWWPGSRSWRRSLVIDLRSNWKRLNWDLHSAIGFWSFALIFMWAITGVYLAFPLPFQKIINHYSTLIQYALPEEVTRAAAPAASVLADDELRYRLQPHRKQSPSTSGRAAAASPSAAAPATISSAGSTTCTSGTSRAGKRKRCG